MQGEALDTASGKLACSQTREIATRHQPLRARLDDFPITESMNCRFSIFVVKAILLGIFSQLLALICFTR